MIRLAEINDIPQILTIFEGAKLRMRQEGNLNQWTGGYPGYEDVKRDIDRGYCHVMCGDGKIYAVFSLIIGIEPTYDVIEGAWLNDEPYATIHRIASDGVHRGVFRQAVEFSRTLSPNLRTDTYKDNISMQNAILKAGFVYCGIIHLHQPGDDARLAYQLPAKGKD